MIVTIYWEDDHETYENVLTHKVDGNILIFRTKDNKEIILPLFDVWVEVEKTKEEIEKELPL